MEVSMGPNLVFIMTAVTETNQYSSQFRYYCSKALLLYSQAININFIIYLVVHSDCQETSELFCHKSLSMLKIVSECRYSTNSHKCFISNFD